MDNDNYNAAPPEPDANSDTHSEPTKVLIGLTSQHNC